MCTISSAPPGALVAQRARQLGGTLESQRLDTPAVNLGNATDPVLMCVGDHQTADRQIDLARDPIEELRRLLVCPRSIDDQDLVGGRQNQRVGADREVWGSSLRRARLRDVMVPEP